MIHKMRVPVVLSLMILGITALPGMSHAATNACGDDVQKFCSDVDPSNKSNIKKCLKSHSMDLSDLCKKKLHLTTTPPATSLGTTPGGDQGGSNTSKTGAPDTNSAPVQQ